MHAIRPWLSSLHPIEENKKEPVRTASGPGEEGTHWGFLLSFPELGVVTGQGRQKLSLWPAQQTL